MTEHETPKPGYHEVQLEMPPYWNEEDVFEQIITDLRDRGVETEHLLFCGYDAATDQEAIRERLFAYTTEEYTRALANPTTGVTDTPLEYAFEGEEPAIGIYDQRHFYNPPAEDATIWQAVDGNIQNGQVAQFKIRPI